MQPESLINFQTVSSLLNAEGNKEVTEKMKRVSFKEYQIIKMIYKDVVVVSASDDEALIFIRK